MRTTEVPAIPSRWSAIVSLRGFTMWSQSVVHVSNDSVYVRAREERRGDVLRVVYADTISEAVWVRGERW